MSHGDIIPVSKYLESIHVRKRLFILLLQNKGNRFQYEKKVPSVLLKI